MAFFIYYSTKSKQDWKILSTQGGISYVQRMALTSVTQLIPGLARTTRTKIQVWNGSQLQFLGDMN